MKRQSCFGFVLLVLLTGCAQITPSPLHSSLATPTTQSPIVAATASSVPLLPPATPVTDPAEAARARLVELLGVTGDEITVISVERTEMELAGLGCTQKEPPQPALVIGTEVTLSAGERVFVYHVHGQQVVLCEER